MELSVIERLMLMNILPEKGNITTLKTIRELREALAFDEDGEALGLDEVDLGDGTKRVDCKDWSVTKEIDIPSRALPVIVESLQRLNSLNQLEDRHLSLYEKFVGES